MKAKNAFVIPIKGMSKGLHQYAFDVDGTFFESIDEAPLSACSIAVDIEADKRENMLLLQFDIHGVMDAVCDRCSADINLPLGGLFSLIVKLAEEELKEDDEVLILHPETADLDLSPYLYDFICLSVPLVKVYDCKDDDPVPCDEKTIAILEGEHADDTDEEELDPIWEELKKKLGE